MSVALPLHILAIVVWLGGLFVVTVVFAPSMRPLDSRTALPLWHRTLSRFFLWTSVGLAVIVGSGIALVQLRFGGFSGMPALHRGNMFIGLPAIALYVYTYFVPWRRCRHALARNDLAAAETNIARSRVLMSVILVLGAVSAAVSAVGRAWS